MNTGDFVVVVKLDHSHKSIKIDDVGIVESVEGTELTIFFVREWQLFKLQSEFLNVFNPLETGDAFPKKICNVCHKLLDTNQFQKNQNGINNRTVRRPSCNACRKNIDGANMTISERKEWLQKKPHMVPFECPICKKHTIPGITSKVVLDHDHVTGTPRAWICDSCNTGIGRFKDDVELLQKAIQYLS